MILQTLAEIATQAEKLKISQFELIEKIYDDKISDIKPPIKRKLASFVKAIRQLRSLDKDVILLSFSLSSDHFAKVRYTSTPNPPS